MLGFLFLVVGIWWMVRAFLERPINPAWWLTLISGILMTIVAFWTSGAVHPQGLRPAGVRRDLGVDGGQVYIGGAFEIRRIPQGALAGRRPSPGRSLRANPPN